MKNIIVLIIFIFSLQHVFSEEKNVTLKIYHTTDIHGNFFPYDFMNNRESKGGFSRVTTYIKEQREKYGDNILLLDGGDLLQGQPSVYYSNFVDTLSTHLCASMMNYMKYDAAAMGNHDIETGHSVYERWVEDCDFPVLAANILTDQGEHYLPPYKIFVKDGIKVAVIGMITKAIPAWLPQNLWSGLHFADIEQTAKDLIPHIKKEENPDIIIGLFHSGVHTSQVGGFTENAGLEVAKEVSGFDVILCGHDHTPFCQKVINNTSDSVLVINPAARGNLISDITLKLRLLNGEIKNKTISGELVNIAELKPDEDFMQQFSEAYNVTMNYVNQEIGEFTNSISAREAYLGPSAFVDLIHTLQLKVTGADISLTAPLSMNSVINKGKIYMRDMFNLYRYENLLYTMSLTGKEVRGALEFSYSLWINQMKSPDDHIFIMKESERDNKYRFIQPFYSFDSAAGIIYTVDVAKPKGEKIRIISMADGKPFDENKIYRVAVNSYQGSGGGDVLIIGSGIPRDKLSERILFSTDKDLRYYLAEEIKRKKIINPYPSNQWRFIPEDWAVPAIKRDYKLLFDEVTN